jgi:DNA-binding beta-propeller fold protein YncE
VPTINGLDLTMSLDANGVVTARIDYTLRFSPEEAAANISVAERAVLARRYGVLDTYTAQASIAAGMQLLVGQAAGDPADQVVAVLQDETASYTSFGVGAGAPAAVPRSFTHTLTDTEQAALLEVGREHPYALVSVLPAGIRADVQIAQVEIDVGDPAAPPPQPAADFPVGTTPRAVAFDGTSVWVANTGSNDVTKIGLDGSLQGPYQAGLTPTAIAVDPGTGTVWVADSGDQLVMVLAPNGTIANQIATAGVPTALAVGGGYVWIATNAGVVEKHDPLVGGNLGSYPLAGKTPSAAVYGDDGVWVADELNGTVAHLRAADGTLVTYKVGTQPLGIAFDGDSVWVTNSGDATVTKLRAADGTSLGVFPVGASPVGVVTANGMAWVANSGGSTVTRLRASDGSIDATIDVGPNPGGIAYDGRNVWVTREGANSVARRQA